MAKGKHAKKIGRAPKMRGLAGEDYSDLTVKERAAKNATMEKFENLGRREMRIFDQYVLLEPDEKNRLVEYLNERRKFHGVD